jgi:very-short-patch-repair endonuclease
MFDTMNHEQSKDFSKHNRTNLTAAEAVLWSLLKGKQLNGKKFRRQHVFGNYIVDFYCFSDKLVVELDSGYHRFQKDYDEQRDNYLKSLELTVLRFKNAELYDNRQKVLETIAQHFKNLHTE